MIRPSPSASPIRRRRRDPAAPEIADLRARLLHRLLHTPRIPKESAAMCGGGAGSRTRVRERAIQVATCVSGDLVFVAGLAHRRGILALSLRSFAAAPAGACTAASP